RARIGTARACAARPRRKTPSMLRLKFVRGAVLKEALDDVNADLRVAVQRFGNGSLRRQSLVEESVVVSGDRFHRQAGVFEEGCAAHLARNHFNQWALRPINLRHDHSSFPSYLYQRYRSLASIAGRNAGISA